MGALQRWWEAQPRSRQSGYSVSGLAAVFLLVVAGFLVRGGEGSEAAPPVAIVATQTPTGPATPTPTPVIDEATPIATQSGIPTYTTLKELRDKVGDPPTANRGRFRIPSAGVDAPLGVRAWTGGYLPSPAGPADVVLYDFSLNTEYGGWPGTGTNVIMSGHVDFSYKLPYANANYHGQGVFWPLRGLVQIGDSVEVTLDGRTYKYSVEWRKTMPENQVRDYLGSGTADVLTLITCDGNFNPATQEYDSRTVVRAVRTS